MRPFRTILLLICFLPLAGESEILPGASDYTFGVSDELSIVVRNLGQTEYSFNVRIPRNGLISVPLLGEVLVRGQSIQQAETLLESKLRNGYLKQPEVTIRVTEYRPFYIDGAVNSPGAYSFQHGLTIEKAIVLAGGLSDAADEANIIVSPENDSDQERTANLAVMVAPGDVITIGESYDQAADSIYLYGAVAKAGAIGYRTGLTVEKAIILAGGFSSRASKKKITIRRSTETGVEEIKRARLSAALQPGDIITIGESLF